MGKLKQVFNDTGIFFDDEEEDLELDSLHFISILCEIENAFDIEIPYEVMTSNELHSFGDFSRLVSKLEEGGV